MNDDSGIIPQREEAKLTSQNPSIHGAVDPALCIFETKAADMAIQSVYLSTFKPIGSITRSRDIEFEIPKTEHYYWNLKKSYIRMKCRILNSQGGTISDDDKVAFAQAPGFSLFQSCKLQLQQHTISPDVGDHYGMKNVLDLLLYAPQEYLESKAQTFLFYKDNSPMDGTDVASQAGVNNGLVERYAYTAKGKEVDMEVPVGHDIWGVDNYIPSGVNIRIKLALQDSAYVLMTSNETERYSYEITSCVLMMYGVIPTDQALTKHQNLLAQQNAIFHYTRSSVQTFTIPLGVSEWEANQIFSDEIPFEIVVCFVRTAAYRGHYKKNPYNFEHIHLSHMGLKIEKYQKMQFNPNFSTYHCATEYNALYDKDEPFLPMETS